MNTTTPFSLFACVFPVSGYTRNVLADVQRGRFYLIPHGLYEILTQQEQQTIDAIKSVYQHEFDAVIDQYFEFLHQEDLIFFTDTPQLFPKIDPVWKSPSWITNAIIDVRLQQPEELRDILFQLDNLSCKSVQLRGYEDIPLNFWQSVLASAEGLRINSIEIVAKHQPAFNQSSIFSLCQQFPRLSIFTAHAAPWSGLVYGAKSGIGHIYYTTENITSESHCGKITAEFFTINIANFTESLHHNSCLNRKIAVDAAGNIKNCPSMSRSFGNIRDTTLREALDHPDFKQYWNVTKDQIAVCKDCEFRYVCTDCRAYLENPEDGYSKPLKCGYNPYTCEWETWSTNPLKQQAIAHYGLRNLLPEFKPEPDHVPA